MGLIAIFGAGVLLVPGVFAQANDNLKVEFEKTPLFEEANFLPGQGITRWVKITNNSDQTQRIAVEAINVSDPSRLGDVLNLEIKEGGIRLYNNALSKFFTEGEVYLSSLANRTSTRYDFIVTFFPGTQNSFQGKSLSFDILVGFQGEEGGILPGAGGGAGGYLPPGLIITNETTEEIGETSVTITWLTSYSSTSQVIYAAEGESYSFDLTKLNYGYPHAFPEPEDSTKLISHSVILTDLTPGTTYYYRCVSHGSLAISTEYSFTTLGVEEAGEEVEPVFAEVSVVGSTKSASGQTKSAGKEEEEEIGGFERPGLVEVGLKEPTGLGKFLAAIGAFPFSPKVILLILVLILIGLFILWLIKKKK